MNYQCAKCSHTEFDTDEIRTTGGTLSKIFDVQNKRFTAVVCRRCSYTEFFRSDSSMLGNIFDLFTG